MDASGECLFYDEVMFTHKMFYIVFLMIAIFSLAACDSGFYFESEVNPSDESGLPVPEIFPTEETPEPASAVDNQYLINILLLIAFGLVSLILILMLGRR